MFNNKLSNIIRLKKVKFFDLIVNINNFIRKILFIMKIDNNNMYFYY